MKQSSRILGLVAVLGTLYAFFLTSGSFSQTARPGEDSYIRGRALANKYECARAIEEFDRAINANPNDPRYYLGRANCSLYGHGNMANSAEEVAERASSLNAVIDGDLSAAIKADSKYALAYFERAKARQIVFQHATADPALALSDFDKALEMEPENLDFLLGRAHFLLIDLKDEKRGLEDMALLIKREPMEPGHLYVRGRFFIEAGRFSEAIQDLSMALKLEPRDKFVRVMRARAYFKSNNHAATLADLKILSRNLDTGISILDAIWVLETRAIIYRKQGKNALAAADERRLKRFKRDLEINDPE